MNLIIFGPPGAGKGTQADFIVNNYNLYQLSTGELLRSEIKNKTNLGKEISSIINSAWVPFPAPGGPNIIRFIKLIIFQTLSF